MLQNCPMYAYIPVADVARARNFYEQRLGTVGGILTAGGAKAAWFKDSEGNTMAVVQSL